MVGGWPALAGAERLGYLAVAIATHAVVGATLAARLGARPAAGALAGSLADADFLFPAAWPFPFVHRGVTHTPAAAAACVLAGYLLADRETALGVGAAYLSHLLLDSLTPKGVLWLYPVSATGFGASVPVHAAVPTVLLWVGCGLVYLADRRWT